MLLQPLCFMALVVVSITGAEFNEAKDLTTILQRIEVLETRDKQQQNKIDLLQRIEVLETRDKQQHNNIDLLQRIEVLETRDQQQQNKIDLLQRIEVLETRDKQQHNKIDLLENEILALKERKEKMANLISERCADRKTATEWTDGELVRQSATDKDVIISHEADNEAENDTVTNPNQESRAESENISDRMHRRASYQNIRRFEGSTEVAFTAALTNHAYHLGTDQPIAFDKVITNVGNAYNAHVGTFIAPIAGVYVFSTTLMSQNTDGDFKIVRNGVQVTRLWVYATPTGYQTSSQTVILQLNQGDDVCIQNEDSDKMLHGSFYSIFSGFLLF